MSELRANLNATRRTKNRLTEHTLTRVEGKPQRRMPQLGGKLCVLTECTDEDCQWRGWLPREELA